MLCIINEKARLRKDIIHGLCSIYSTLCPARRRWSKKHTTRKENAIASLPLEGKPLTGRIRWCSI